MARASRLAARPPRKGGLPNALFVVAAAEALPIELDGAIDAATIHFPWGSLLRGAVRASSWLTAGLSRIVRPPGSVELLLSTVDRDGLDRIGALDLSGIHAVATGWQEAGFAVRELRPAAMADLEASRSSWAKRLAADRDRPVWLLRLEKASPGPGRTVR
jgi:16S rRNA (adenine(1408)-N(1))-methyltransferase